jgi:hypothetical protein
MEVTGGLGCRFIVSDIAPSDKKLKDNSSFSFFIFGF